jgi:hypothetical protein
LPFAPIAPFLAVSARPLLVITGAGWPLTAPEIMLPAAVATVVVPNGLLIAPWKMMLVGVDVLVLAILILVWPGDGLVVKLKPDLLPTFTLTLPLKLVAGLITFIALSVRLPAEALTIVT